MVIVVWLVQEIVFRILLYLLQVLDFQKSQRKKLEDHNKDKVCF